MTQSIYDFKVKTITDNDFDLSELKGKVILIVNTASKCGFTPQYAELEELYKEFSNEGFIVLGFPCNQFGAQEPASEDVIQEFCQLNYGVTFPMMAKIDVNGINESPLYTYLKNTAKGIFGSKSIKWNFTKFLINKDASVVVRYAPTLKPRQLKHGIKSLLDE